MHFKPLIDSWKNEFKHVASLKLFFTLKKGQMSFVVQNNEIFGKVE